MGRLSKEQIVDLLNYIGVDKIGEWKDNTIQFCCPIHGESNPSCGINCDFVPRDSLGSHYQVYNCFSCGSHGDLPKFLWKSLPDDFKTYRKALEFIENRYSVSLSTFDLESSKDLENSYDDLFIQLENSFLRFTQPLSKLAPFKSGKSTYQYFLNRGFDYDDIREYMIGRDTINKTITIPVFWEDKQLAGVIGRYVCKRPKNMRYKIYNFPREDLIYPLDKVESINDTIILLEGMLDVIMLRKWGYKNAVCQMGGGISERQVRQIVTRASKVILLYDNDNGGRKNIELAEKAFKGRAMLLYPSYYPPTGKDPCDWGKDETDKVISSAKFLSQKLLQIPEY